MFSKILRETRIAAGLTQEELAFKTGLHRTYISMLERDKGSPTLDTLFKLCAVMEILPSELVKRVEATGDLKPPQE